MMFKNQTVRTILDIVEENQAFALGWLIPVLIVPTLFTNTVAFIFVILLIINRFYQLRLKYERSIREINKKYNYKEVKHNE